MTKWYLDCVDERGNLSIAYWARLRWRALSLIRASILQLRQGRVTTRARSGRIAAPQLDGDSLSWRGLGLQIEMRRRAARFATSLVDGVLWRCEMPRAEGVIRDDQGELRGDGYAEVIEMSLAPWKLPIDELRWGRFVTPADSVVWIDWRGPRPLTLVLRDGSPDRAAMVHDSKISLENEELILDQRQTIRDAMLGALVKRVPLPKRIAQAREQKWRSRGRLMRDGAVVGSGWSIHELVCFP